jgi:hypothetical protein
MNGTDITKMDLVLSQLQTGCPVRVKANGFSMEPVIRNGAVLTLVRSDAERLKAGDIVAFLNDDTLFIHRLILVHPDSGSLLTMGDHLEYSDRMLKNEEILARVTEIDGRPLPGNSLLMKIIFRIYLYTMFFGNASNLHENGKVTRILLTGSRVRISRLIIHVYSKVLLLTRAG